MISEELNQLEKLTTAGFVHIKSFLKPGEIERFKRDFKEKDVAGGSENKNYHIPYLSEKAIDRIKTKVLNICKESTQLGVRANLIEGGAYFCTRGGQTFPWHQDHESYITWQNHTDYLNFYMPLVKPDLQKSNISIIPYDVLEKKYPDLHNMVKGKGAIAYNVHEGKTYVVDDNYGRLIYEMDCDIKDLSVTPNLEVGDLLLMRGDVIHQTQDTETYRIAASLRVLYDESIVNYQKLIYGGNAKRRLMFGNQSSYNFMIAVFRKYKSDNLKIKTFIENQSKFVFSPNFRPKFLYDLYMSFLQRLDYVKNYKKYNSKVQTGK